MASATVRINADTHAKLRELSLRAGRSMPDVLDAAVEAYRRQAFLEEANRAFAALKADPDAWAEELAERAAFDATLSDGLED